MILLAIVHMASASSTVRISLVPLLEALAAIVTVGGGILFLVKQGKVQRERNDRFDRDWYGEPERPGVEARPGVLEQLQTVRVEVGEIRAEVFPNHGGSIKDVVTTTSIRLEAVELDVKGIHDRLDNKDGVEVHVHT